MENTCLAKTIGKKIFLNDLGEKVLNVPEKMSLKINEAYRMSTRVASKSVPNCQRFL
jgi:hypothetical protein